MYFYDYSRSSTLNTEGRKCLAVEFSFSANLTASLEQIYGYDQLKIEAESLRRTTYSSDDPTHERLLLTVSNVFLSDHVYRLLSCRLHIHVYLTCISYKALLSRHVSRKDFC